MAANGLPHLLKPRKYFYFHSKRTGMIHNEDPLYCIFNHRKINLQLLLFSFEDPLNVWKRVWVVKNLSEKE